MRSVSMLAMVLFGVILGEASSPTESDVAEQLLREALEAHGGQGGEHLQEQWMCPFRQFAIKQQEEA